jgi:hypothetical protein
VSGCTIVVVSQHVRVQKCECGVCREAPWILTLARFYIEPGAKNSFIIHLQGGGECASDTGCRSLLKTALGSSKYFQPEQYLGFLNDDNCTRNPGFCEWNHVFIPYCSQDLFSGQRTATSPDTFGVYFSGAHIFSAVLDELIASYGLKGAENIILSGDSAGGIATWLHVDRLASRVPTARVANVPFAGFYFYVRRAMCCSPSLLEIYFWVCGLCQSERRGRGRECS